MIKMSIARSAINNGVSGEAIGRGIRMNFGGQGVI